MSTKLPLYLTSVQAGFPSPADDYIDRHLDLNEYLIDRPAATYFVRVKGDSMQDFGIDSGDLLVVDKSLRATNGSIVIAALEGELTVKRLAYHNQLTYLEAGNPNYRRIKVDETDDFTIWGVVTYTIKCMH